MGQNGDSSTSDYGSIGFVKINAYMTFTSPMYNYSAWDGSSWISATGVSDPSHIGPSWVND